jgi:phytanoyl-CoA hydroxylase
MSSSSAEGLTAEQLEFWDKNGYLIIPDALSQDTVDELLAESHKLLEGRCSQLAPCAYVESDI